MKHVMYGYQGNLVTGSSFKPRFLVGVFYYLYDIKQADCLLLNWALGPFLVFEFKKYLGVGVVYYR